MVVAQIELPGPFTKPGCLSLIGAGSLGSKELHSSSYISIDYHQFIAIYLRIPRRVVTKQSRGR